MGHHPQRGGDPLPSSQGAVGSPRRPAPVLSAGRAQTHEPVRGSSTKTRQSCPIPVRARRGGADDGPEDDPVSRASAVAASLGSSPPPLGPASLGPPLGPASLGPVFGPLLLAQSLGPVSWPRPLGLQSLSSSQVWVPSFGLISPRAAGLAGCAAAHTCARHRLVAGANPVI